MCVSTVGSNVSSHRRCEHCHGGRVAGGGQALWEQFGGCGGEYEVLETVFRWGRRGADEYDRGWLGRGTSGSALA